MAADVLEAQRHGLLDQRAQHATPARQSPDRGVGGVVDPPCDEPGSSLRDSSSTPSAA